MGINLQNFADKTVMETKPVLFEKTLPTAVCYAFRYSKTRKSTATRYAGGC